MAWVIFYEGEETHSSFDREEPFGWGVLAVVQDHPDVGKQLVTSTDYYVLRDGRWVGVDLAGLLDHVVNVLHVALVGRMVQDREYWSVVSRANAEREKTGWLSYERRLSDGLL